MAGENVVTIRELSKVYQQGEINVTALNNIRLDIGAGEFLALMGPADRARHLPKQLSGGQEQRAATARALVTDPSLVVADEPTGNLDSQSAQEVLTILQALSRSAGKTVIMVTHDPKAAAFGSRSIHLEKGELVNGATGLSAPRLQHAAAK